MDGGWVIDNAWIIPLLPFAAAVIQVAIGERLGEKTAWIGVIAMGGATVLATAGLMAMLGGAAEVAVSLPWLQIGDVEIEMGYRVANLEAAMLFVVSLVAWMVQIYSVGYMAGDNRFNRFFTVVDLFTAAMLLLVLADNFILFLVSWEIMGLCSYLLIGHWFENIDNAVAALKAFLTTRVGDVALMVGIWLTFVHTGTFNFAGILGAVEAGQFAGPALTLAGILIFGGAIGKSAQFPLQVWLPDAMAGPTPVSALIHAATMVAAGVFLVARVFPIFSASPEAMLVVAFIGAITALIGATVATVNHDIKGVLAYSTISQLGYMVMALGVAGYTAGLFHLMTHAFFKALLFLGAGSVIHAAGTQNLHEMGGLWSKMKVTGATFIIGALALAGIPPLAGYYSKDEILLAAYNSEYQILFWIGAAAALLTAYYMTRAVWLTFFGAPRDEGVYEQAHESPAVMTIPMVVLAAGSAVGGYLALPEINEFITSSAAHHPEATSFVPTVATGAAVLGVLIGAAVYAGRLISRESMIRGLRPLYAFFKNAWYIDHLYGWAVVRGGLALATLADLFDRYIVDGLVNGVAALAVGTGSLTRRLTSGYVQGYVMTLVASVVLGVVLYMVLVPV